MKAKIIGLALIGALSMGAANAHHATISTKIKIGSGHIKIKAGNGHRGHHGHVNRNRGHGQHGHHSNNSYGNTHSNNYGNSHSNNHGNNHNYGHNNTHGYTGHNGYNNHNGHRGKADLVIRKVHGVAPRYNHRRGGYEVMVKVKNVGQRRSQPTRVRVVENRHQQNHAGNRVPGLAPGETRRVRIVLPHRPQYRVNARVNPRNNVNERNYRNNGWAGRI